MFPACGSSAFPVYENTVETSAVFPRETGFLPCHQDLNRVSCGAHDSHISSADVSSCPRSPHPSPLSLPEILGNWLYFQPPGFLVNPSAELLRNKWPTGELKKEEGATRPTQSRKGTVLHLKTLGTSVKNPLSSHALETSVYSGLRL